MMKDFSKSPVMVNLFNLWALFLGVLAVTLLTFAALVPLAVRADEAVPQALPQALPQAAPEVAPVELPEAAPEVAPEAAAAPEVVPQALPEAVPAAPIRSVAPAQVEKIEITRKNNHIVIKTRLNRMDLRKAFAAVLEEGKPATATATATAPADPAAAPTGALRVLDFYLDINEMLLPSNVIINDINSFFVYEDYLGNDEEKSIFTLVESLGNAVNSDLLLGMKRLQLDGKLLNDKKLTDISIRMAPIDNKQRTILIRSSDINAMIKIMGLENFEGTDYVLHAKWVDGETNRNDWEITGSIRIQDFYINKPKVLTRVAGSLFSLRGLISSLTSNRIYFEKMEFLFKISKKKRDVRCQIYFGPETSLPCGDY